MKTSSGRCKHVAVFVSSKPKKDDKNPRGTNTVRHGRERRTRKSL